MPITQTITTLPAAPSSSDPSTFETKADAFVAALPALVTEINTWADQADALAVTVNADADAAEDAKIAAQLAETNAETAETNAETAQAAAEAAATNATNAANVYGTSTSSVSIPTSESGTRTFVYVEASRAIALGMHILAASSASPTNWILIRVTSWDSGTKTVIGDVVTFEGTGTFNSWVLSLSGPRGATGEDSEIISPKRVITTSGSITAADNGYNLDVTAAGVTLTPDTAAAMDQTSCIINAVGYDVTVAATFNDGETSKVLLSGTSVVLSCNGTTFRWQFYKTPKDQLGALGTPAVVKAYNQQTVFTAVPLTDTTSLVVYVASGTTLEAAVVTRSGATLSVGTPLVINTSGEAGISLGVRAKKLDASRVLLMHGINGLGLVRMVVLSISGTTVTENAGVDWSASVPSRFDFALCSPTVAVAFYMSSGSTAAARHIAISGTTLTASTAVNVVTDGEDVQVLGISAAGISATQAVLYCRVGTGQYGRVHLITLTGTVPANSVTRGFTHATGTEGGNCVLTELSNGNALAVVSQPSGNISLTTCVEILASGSAMIFGPASAMLFDTILTPFPRAAELANGRVALATIGLGLGSVVSFAERLADAESWRLIAGKGATNINASSLSDIGAVFPMGNDYLGILYKDYDNSSYTTVRTLGLGNIARNN